MSQTIKLQSTGYIRLSEILKLIPVSKSTWYAGIKSGRFPKPVEGFGGRMALWRVEDIRQLIETPEATF